LDRLGLLGSNLTYHESDCRAWKFFKHFLHYLPILHPEKNILAKNEKKRPKRKYILTKNEKKTTQQLVKPKYKKLVVHCTVYSVVLCVLCSIYN